MNSLISRGLGLFLVFALIVAEAQEEDIEHKIPPGYQPEEARDEQGIWLETLEYEAMLQKSPLLVRDHDLNEYVQTVVCEVAGEYCPDIRVYLVRNPGFNASMTATGMMQIWTGLLLRTPTTNELASVIGHELAHYTRLHTLERFRRAKRTLAAGSIFDLGVTLLAGVSTPIGQLTAVMATLAYSRSQESEADLLGARLIADAGMDPHAGYRVWRLLIEEEEAAIVKLEKSGSFFQTHPSSEHRAEELRQWVTARYGSVVPNPQTSDRHVSALNDRYFSLMEDQLDTNRFGRTQELLRRHAEMGVNGSIIQYFYGEMYRQQNAEGDTGLAIEAYLKSIELGEPPPEAFKNLGYLYLKADDTARARENFREYLESDPDPSDRAMIEFYLEE